MQRSVSLCLLQRLRQQVENIVDYYLADLGTSTKPQYPNLSLHHVTKNYPLPGKQIGTFTISRGDEIRVSVDRVQLQPYSAAITLQCYAP